MRRLLLGVAAAAGLAAAAGPAHAQGWQKNYIQNSGNGVGNSILAVNSNPVMPFQAGPGAHAAGWGFAGHPAVGYTPVPAAPQGGMRNTIIDSGNGAYNTIQARNIGAPAGFAGQPWAAGGYYPPVGYGQPAGFAAPAGVGYPTGFAPSAGVGYPGGYGYDPNAPFPFGMRGFGVNINVVANSGNGQGNTIHTMNRSFGGNGVNINVVTNSGNGIGNLIRAINR